jgi:hypothetical protein
MSLKHFYSCEKPFIFDKVLLGELIPHYKL